MHMCCLRKTRLRSLVIPESTCPLPVGFATLLAAADVPPEDVPLAQRVLETAESLRDASVLDCASRQATVWTNRDLVLQVPPRNHVFVLSVQNVQGASTLLTLSQLAD